MTEKILYNATVGDIYEAKGTFELPSLLNLSLNFAFGSKQLKSFFWNILE